MRRRQSELARRRMMADVPTADVVIVNPTHYAVALRYDGTQPAPEVVAKGVDNVALAIRKAAEEAGVTIVHEAPLARALYRDVEIGAADPGGALLRGCPGPRVRAARGRSPARRDPGGGELMAVVRAFRWIVPKSGDIAADQRVAVPAKHVPSRRLALRCPEPSPEGR